MPEPRPTVAGPLVVLLLGAVLLTGCGGSKALAGDPAQVAGPSVQPPAAAGVDDLLRTRSAAVLARSSAGAAATAAPAAGASVRDLVARTRALPLTAWSYDVGALTPGSAAGQATVRVTLRYRLAADAADRTAARVLTVRSTAGGGAVVVDDQPVGAALPWDLGPAAWASGPSAAVVVVDEAQDGDASSTAAALLPAVTSAVATVRSVLPAAMSGLSGGDAVVVGVRGSAALARLTGRTAGQATGLAAVTTTDRVVVDLDEYGRLAVPGRSVLLAHELTHLATGAATSDAPQWLEEGLADYVGLTGSPLAASAASALLDRVRRSGPPAALPDDADFGTSGPGRDQAYAGAWLAARMVAERAGRQALLAVYRAVAAGTPVDAALTAATGLGTAAWTARWRAWLTELAG